VNPDVQIGRVAGIRIGINWSWLVVFALIVWTLAAGVFPSENPGLGNVTYVAMAVVAALTFFASLVLHELGHALQARRDGVQIEGITLWLFGGVAQFKGMFPTAGAEFRIALAGPLISLAIGSAFVAVAGLSSLPDPVDGVVAWLGYINLTLLVFNLLPALPLDGGRLLRATLWHAKGDFSWATTVAADVGRVFGYLLISGGILLFVLQSSFSGAWLAFIGWFLLQAAAAEARYGGTEQALRGLRVRDLMTRDPITVPADLTLGEFVDEIAWTHRFTTYPVLEDERPVGLLAFRAVAAVPRREWEKRRVRDCMLPREQVPVIAADATAFEALGVLAASEVNRGLVLEGERLEALLSITDLARALELRRPRRPGRP
jgi:Zn-dependent protease/CBS domain-containing protein